MMTLIQAPDFSTPAGSTTYNGKSETMFFIRVAAEPVNGIRGEKPALAERLSDDVFNSDFQSGINALAEAAALPVASASAAVAAGMMSASTAINGHNHLSSASSLVSDDDKEVVPMVKFGGFFFIFRSSAHFCGVGYLGAVKHRRFIGLS